MKSAFTSTENVLGSWFIALLQWRLFLDTKKGLCVNHINGIKTDNRPRTLRLALRVTSSIGTGLVTLNGGSSQHTNFTTKRVATFASCLHQNFSTYACRHRRDL